MKMCSYIDFRNWQLKVKRCDGYLFGGLYDGMFGLNKQKIIVYDTPGFGDSDMGKVFFIKTISNKH